MAVKKIETLNKHQNPATNENEFDIENYMNVNWDKIKEVVDNNADELTTTQGKVTALETDNTKNKQDISNIKSNQTTQNDLLQRTQSALINITTPKSSNINVKDSSDLNAKVNVYGISRQKTRSGKNKWVNKIQTQTVNGITVTRNQDGSLTFNGTATAVTTFYFETDTEGTVEFKEGETYTISGINSGESQIYQTCMIANYGPGTEETRTLTVATTRKANSSNSYIRFASGTVLNNYTIKPQIELGEVATSYEQYGASPSPEFPSEIQNVTGDIDITVCNKNLFTGFTKGKGLNDTTGEETTNSTGAVSNFIEVGFSKNSNYYLSGLTNTLNSYIAAYNKNKEFLGRIGANAQTNISFNKDSFTLYSAEGDIAFVRVTQYEITTSTGTIDDIDDLNVQLEANNVATDFIAHEEQLITFPLAQGQRLMEKDYPASDGIHHVRKQVVLDGTENWIVSGNSYYLTVAGKKLRYELTKGKMLCTHFKETTTGVAGEVEVGEFFEGYYSTGNRNVFFNYDNGVGGVEGFKSYLAQQKTNGTPVIIEYELEEEIVEPYTPEQQEAHNQLQNAKTYKTVTNVFTENAELEMEYIADTKTYIDNEINSIKEQINTINELLSTTNTSAMLLDNMQTDLESEVL